MAATVQAAEPLEASPLPLTGVEDRHVLHSQTPINDSGAANAASLFASNGMWLRRLLPLVARRRCFTVRIVAPARDAPVLTQTAGVPRSRAYRLEPFAFRRVCPRGVVHPLHAEHAQGK